MRVKSHIFKVGIGLGVLGFLAGCTTGLSSGRYLANKQEHMVKQGNPPAFVEGYVDGCSSGRRLSGDKKFAHRKDSLRFEKDALYARGWQEGQINCRNEALSEATGALDGFPNNAGVLDNSIDAERHRRVEAESRVAEKQMHEIWEELKK